MLCPQRRRLFIVQLEARQMPIKTTHRREPKHTQITYLDHPLPPRVACPPLQVCCRCWCCCCSRWPLPRHGRPAGRGTRPPRIQTGQELASPSPSPSPSPAIVGEPPLSTWVAHRAGEGREGNGKGTGKERTGRGEERREGENSPHAGNYPKMLRAGSISGRVMRANKHSYISMPGQVGHGMPCYAMSCHAMSCHVMPCHAMPCHVCLKEHSLQKLIHAQYGYATLGSSKLKHTPEDCTTEMMLKFPQDGTRAASQPVYIPHRERRRDFGEWRKTKASKHRTLLRINEGHSRLRDTPHFILIEDGAERHKR